MKTSLMDSHFLQGFSSLLTTQSTLQRSSHSPSHIPCKVPSAHQEQFGVQHLAQRDINWRPSTPSTSWATATPTSFKLLVLNCFFLWILNGYCHIISALLTSIQALKVLSRVKGSPWLLCRGWRAVAQSGLCWALRRKGDWTLRAAAIVNMGSSSLNKEPSTSIFPEWMNDRTFYFVSLFQVKESKSELMLLKVVWGFSPMTTSTGSCASKLPIEVNSPRLSSAPCSFRYVTAVWILEAGGGSIKTKESGSPRHMLFICRNKMAYLKLLM